MADYKHESINNFNIMGTWCFGIPHSSQSYLWEGLRLQES